MAATAELDAIGRALGVLVVRATTPAAVESTIARLDGIDRVFVDTTGAGPAHMATLAEVAAFARSAGEDAERVLVVSATTAPAIVTAALRAFELARPTSAIVAEGRLRAMGADRESDRRTRHQPVRAGKKPKRRGFADARRHGWAGTPPARCLTSPRMPITPPDAPTVPPVSLTPAVRVIAVASGKGGVGKTNVTANLAVTLARRGTRVWVLDADLGLANVDLVYGVRPTHTIEAVLRGERRLSEVVVDGPAGVRLVAAASGTAELTALSPAQQLCILDEVDALDGEIDVLLIDVAAGISSNVLYFAAAASETLVVTTPEPTAVADAYALIKTLATRWERRTFPVLVNMAASAADAETTFAASPPSRSASCRCSSTSPVGSRSTTWCRARYARTRRSCSRRPGAPAAHAIAALADRLGRGADPAVTGGLQFFRRLVEGRA